MNKKKISKVDIFLMALFVVVVAWILVSWLDVIFNNSNETAIYSNWNFFNLLLKGNRAICG